MRQKERGAATHLTAFGHTERLKDWAKITGIPIRILLSRYYCGRMTPEEMLTIKPIMRIKPRKIQYEAFGEFHTLAEWARIKNINACTLNNRIYVAKMSLEEALKHPVRKKNL